MVSSLLELPTVSDSSAYNINTRFLFFCLYNELDFLFSNVVQSNGCIVHLFYKKTPITTHVIASDRSPIITSKFNRSQLIKSFRKLCCFCIHYMKASRTIQISRFWRLRKKYIFSYKIPDHGQD